MNIIARRTHYEIHGYMLGSYPKIEEMFYIWDQSRYQRTNYYYYDEETYSMVGKESNKQYHLGQKVRIKVKDTDKIVRTIDFELVEESEEP